MVIKLKIFSVLNFNTTIVSVESVTLDDNQIFIVFQYNYCFGGIEGEVMGVVLQVKFQYNYCFGGILLYNPNNYIRVDFNTTIVSVE